MIKLWMPEDSAAVAVLRVFVAMGDEHYVVDHELWELAANVVEEAGGWNLVGPSLAAFATVFLRTLAGKQGVPPTEILEQIGLKGASGAFD